MLEYSKLYTSSLCRLTMSEQKSTKHHHGRGYQCRHCLKDGKEYIQEKQRVEDHIRKQHLNADQLPFYCTLCLFRCTRREELRRHVLYYKWHAARLTDEKGNAIQDSPDFLVENPKPYTIGLQDYIVLSREDSDSYFAQRREARRASSDTGDLLSQAVQALHRQVGEDLDYNSSQGQSPCEESRQETDPSRGSQDTNVPPTTLLASTLLPPALDVNIQPHDPNGSDLESLFQFYQHHPSPSQEPSGSDHRTGFNDGLLVTTYISYFIRSRDLGQIAFYKFCSIAHLLTDS